MRYIRIDSGLQQYPGCMVLAALLIIRSYRCSFLHLSVSNYIYISMSYCYSKYDFLGPDSARRIELVSRARRAGAEDHRRRHAEGSRQRTQRKGPSGLLALLGGYCAHVSYRLYPRGTASRWTDLTDDEANARSRRRRVHLWRTAGCRRPDECRGGPARSGASLRRRRSRRAACLRCAAALPLDRPSLATALAG